MERHPDTTAILSVTRERAREDERGVTLILFTLMLTVLLVFVALALDTGLVYNEHRQDQSAADAAALAAIKDLVTNGTNGRAAAVQTIFDLTWENTRTTNGQTQSAWETRWGSCTDPERDASLFPVVSSQSPCISFAADNTRVRVKLPSMKVQSTFGQVVGVDKFTTTAAAEAEAFIDHPYAVFGTSLGRSPTCDPTVSVSIGERRSGPTTISGTVHSNEEVDIQSGVRADLVTYVAGNPPPQPQPSQQVGPQPDPLAGTINVQDYRRFGSKANLAGAKYKEAKGVPVDNAWFDANVGRNPDGTLIDNGVLVYTDSGIELSGDIKGKITFVNESDAPVSFHDGNFEVTPWDTNGLLAFSTSVKNCDVADDTNAITLQNVGGSWDGLWYAPRGGLRVFNSPASKTFLGELVAKRIELEGGDYTITSKYESSGPPDFRLFR
jgi:Flp pilus assembly protein TadG